MLNFSGRQAKLRYLPGSFQVLQPGDYVLCAVTSQRVAVNDLRYWSHEVQEAYAGAEVAVRRYAELKAARRL